VSSPENKHNAQWNSGLSKSISSDDPKSPYAYAFLIGRCCGDETGIKESPGGREHYNPDKYRPYLYSVLVAVYILRQQGSTADVLLYIDVDDGVLFVYEPNLARAISELRVIMRKIPQQGSFYQLQLQKFRILGEVQYKRILYLDSDVMPTANLDYLFAYSDPDVHWLPALEENFVVTGKYAPINGGFFMVTPHEGDIEKINELIQAKESAQLRNNGTFDVRRGWDIHSDNSSQRLGPWKALLTKGFDWSFNAADGDQGLLLYWVMHVKKRVSVLTLSNEKIEHWIVPPRSDEGGAADQVRREVQRKTTFTPPLSERDPVHCWGAVCDGSVWSNFVHFYGSRKPWYVGYPFGDSHDGSDPTTKNTTTSATTKKIKKPNGYQYWLSTFKERIDVDQALKREGKNRTAAGRRMLNNNTASDVKFKSEIHYWFAMLMELNDEYNAKIDVVNGVLVRRREKKKRKVNYAVGGSHVGAKMETSSIQRLSFPTSLLD